MNLLVVKNLMPAKVLDVSLKNLLNRIYCHVRLSGKGVCKYTALVTLTSAKMMITGATTSKFTILLRSFRPLQSNPILYIHKSQM
jgi:hypothetical protein